MEVVSTFSMISINATLLVQVLSFLIFLFMINRLMFRPLRATIAKREKTVEAIQQEVDAEKSKIETVLQKLADDEAHVKQEALVIQKQLENEGLLKAREVFEAGQLEIEKLKERSRQMVQRQIKAVRKQLAEESHKLARILMDKALERGVAHE